MNNIIGKPAIESIAYICTRNNYEIIADNKESLIWFTNIILDIVFINLFPKIGIPAYFGASAASIIMKA